MESGLTEKSHKPHKLAGFFANKGLQTIFMNGSESGQTRLAYLPNSISLCRLLSTPVLVWLAVREHAEVFAAGLVLALASDVIDGWLARRLNLTSPAGALLDSTADIALTLAILLSIWFLHPDVYEADGRVIYTVCLAWLLAHSASLWRYGRLASFHTWLIRLGITVFNGFALVLFLFSYQPWLLYLAAALSILGVIEHFLLLALLRKWTPDVPGGLISVLRNRSKVASTALVKPSRNDARQPDN